MPKSNPGSGIAAAGEVGHAKTLPTPSAAGPTTNTQHQPINKGMP